MKVHILLSWTEARLNVILKVFNSLKFIVIGASCVYALESFVAFMKLQVKNYDIFLNFRYLHCEIL